MCARFGETPVARTLRRASSRRRFLGFVATSVGLVAGACSRGPQGPFVDVELDAIPDGGRLRVMLDDEPVELRRNGDVVTARSLWCTHMGCELQWNADVSQFECPCHEGRFAADGRVVSGPPLQPMRTLATHVEAGRVRVTPE